jgi:hypothetical protein
MSSQKRVQRSGFGVQEKKEKEGDRSQSSAGSGRRRIQSSGPEQTEKREPVLLDFLDPET